MHALACIAVSCLSGLFLKKCLEIFVFIMAIVIASRIPPRPISEVGAFRLGELRLDVSEVHDQCRLGLVASSASWMEQWSNGWMNEWMDE